MPYNKTQQRHITKPSYTCNEASKHAAVGAIPLGRVRCFYSNPRQEISNSKNFKSRKLGSVPNRRSLRLDLMSDWCETGFLRKRVLVGTACQNSRTVFLYSSTLRSSILSNKDLVKLFLFANNQKAEKKAIHIVDRDHGLSLWEFRTCDECIINIWGKLSYVSSVKIDWQLIATRLT